MDRARQFEITLIVNAAPSVEPENLKSAMRVMLARAARFPPDSRVSWGEAYIDVVDKPV